MKKISKKTLVIIISVIFVLSLILIVIDFLASGNWRILQSLKLYFSPIVVKKGSIKAQVIFPGAIDFNQHSLLQFQQIPSGGIMISSIGVKVGDKVKKGQFIASLDQQTMLKQQQLNLSNFLNQRYVYDQAISDNGGRTDPNQALNDTQKRTLLENQISLNNSVYNVELQDQAQKLSNLYTPIDGVVTRVDSPFAGVNIASADEAKFEVINPNTLFFNVDVDETEISNLHAGDKGIIILNAFPTDYIQSTIKNIAFTSHLDSNNNTVYTTKLALDNKTDNDYKYKFGMNGYVIFYEYNTNVLYVPNEYLHTDTNGTFLKIGSNRKLTYVQTGISDGKVTEIMKGVGLGDEIYY